MRSGRWTRSRPLMVDTDRGLSSGLVSAHSSTWCGSFSHIDTSSTVDPSSQGSETTSSGTASAGRYPIPYSRSTRHTSALDHGRSPLSIPTQWTTKYNRSPRHRRYSRHMALNCPMNHIGYRICPDEDSRIHVYAPMHLAPPMFDKV
jgi:hypothetical protein